MIGCHDLSVDIAGTPILRRVSLGVADGRWLSIVGPNGAGKTTLLRALAGLQRHRGAVRIDGERIDELRPAARARRVAYVPQHPTIPPGVGVYDYVLLGRTPHLRPLAAERALDHEVAERTLAELDLEPFAGRLLSSLSGGERQRVVLARALAQEAPVLLLDEPITGLDIGHQQDVLDRLDTLRSVGRRCIIATLHDLTLAGAYADELALLVGGEVIAHGPPAETLTEERLVVFGRARVRLLAEEGAPVVVPLPPRRSPRPGAGAEEIS